MHGQHGGGRLTKTAKLLWNHQATYPQFNETAPGACVEPAKTRAAFRSRPRIGDKPSQAVGQHALFF
jgi:hypothetical protein